MTIMLSIDNVSPGITAGNQDTTPVVAGGTVDNTAGDTTLVPGSATARALYQAWSGCPVTIVDSPPGAGKSTLVTEVLSILERDTDIPIAVATPTRRQAVDLALRINARTKKGTVWLELGGLNESDCPDDMFLDVRDIANYQVLERGQNHVLINTLSSFANRKNNAEILVIDEAYQATYADVLSVASRIRVKQILMVGDPGQIGPVVTVDTRIWDHLDYAPHRRAPEVFALRDDAEIINMPSSYRLGPDTVKAIAPLYDFEFTSARPRRELVGFDEIESIELVDCHSRHDMSMLAEVASRAADLIGETVSTNDGDRALTPQDIAVVVSHNAQVSVIKGYLENSGETGITVGTADKMQGGQWEAVVALDPLTGATSVDSHSMSLGRLCVMCSRHRTHLTFMHDGRWRDLLDNDDDISDDERETAIAVRERITDE